MVCPPFDSVWRSVQVKRICRENRGQSFTLRSQYNKTRWQHKQGFHGQHTLRKKRIIYIYLPPALRGQNSRISWVHQIPMAPVDVEPGASRPSNLRTQQTQVSCQPHGACAPWTRSRRRGDTWQPWWPTIIMKHTEIAHLQNRRGIYKQRRCLSHVHTPEDHPFATLH